MLPTMEAAMLAAACAATPWDKSTPMTGEAKALWQTLDYTCMLLQCSNKNSECPDCR